jgi:erythromycin esterase
MIGILALAAAAATRLPYDARDEAAARAWIAKAGHRFDPASPQPADLAPLVARLQGARVIGIGEATHGTHQDEAFKAELIKALVRAGAIDMLAIECNRAAGAGFDRYVRTGEGDPAALMRSPAFFRIWHNDEFGGLLLWLRAWNQTVTKPVRIIGIDNQDTSDDAALALRFLARHDAEVAGRIEGAMHALLPATDGKPVFLYDWLVRTEGPAFEAILAAANGLEKALTDAPAAWRGDPDYDEARYAATVARQGLWEFAGEYLGADRSKNDAEYFGRRDVFMAENLIDRVGQGRAALWAHDAHIVSAVAPAREGTGFRNLGSSIKAKLGAAYRTVDFTWSLATLHVMSLPTGAPNPSRDSRRYSDVPLRNDHPGDFGHVFAGLPADAMWVDLAARPHTPALDRWSERPLHRGWQGARVDPARFQDYDPPAAPGRGTDVLVWFRSMGPARVWPEPVPAL